MSPPDGKLLLLDTHIWVWLINGDAKMASSSALPLIEAAADKNALRVGAEPVAFKLEMVAMLFQHAPCFFSCDQLHAVNNIFRDERKAVGRSFE